MISVALCTSLHLPQSVTCSSLLKKVNSWEGLQGWFLHSQVQCSLHNPKPVGLMINRFEPHLRLWISTFNNLFRLILMIRPKGNIALTHLTNPKGRPRRKSRELWDACSESWHIFKNVYWAPSICYANPFVAEQNLLFLAFETKDFITELKMCSCSHTVSQYLVLQCFWLFRHLMAI